MIEGIENIKSLLQKTERIVIQQEEIKRLRGENFNVFSILKMETSENETHSAFLGELLDPNGSHLLRNIFLHYFLGVIDYKGDFDINTAKLTLEKSVGTRNDKLKTGGRIDIYLIDSKGNSISIENKIYAVDQFAQVERYLNHNGAKNTVYYLTLDGKPASANSKGKLEEERNYFCISYRQTILAWLEKCLKESAEQPILRESIRQYIILIKKLTNQLTDTKMKNDIHELLAKNYRAAKLIYNNIWEIELNAASDFLNDIKREFEKEMKDDWDVDVDDDLDQSMTGMRITHKDWNELIIKVEGGNKVPWAVSWYGLFAPSGSYDQDLVYGKLNDTALIKENYRNSQAWPWYMELMSFATDEQRARLFDPIEKNELLKDVSARLIDLAKECQDTLSNIKNKQS